MRFVVYVNDVTYLRTENLPLSHYHSEAHDEGWSSHYHEWWVEGQFVYQRTTSDGTDCDGRLTRTYTSRCHLSALRSRFNEYTQLWQPAWQEVDERRRDYQAEAAGY